MTALENITIYYNQLPKNDTKRDILSKLLPHIRSISSMTIYDTADLCFTSTASISRLVKALGYKSYSEFQIRLNDCVQRYDYDNRFLLVSRSKKQEPADMITSAMRYMVDEFQRNIDLPSLERLIDSMHSASRVVLFSYGIRFMESALQSDLIVSGIPCDIVISDRMQAEFAQYMQKDELALFLCPDAVDSIHPLSNIIQTVASHGSKIAILSSSDQQPFLSHADYIYSFNGNHSMADSFELQMQLALIDMMYRTKYVDQ